MRDPHQNVMDPQHFPSDSDHKMLTATFLPELGAESVDIVSMVFVLSAIHPQKHKQVSPPCYH